eukprot:Gb_28166 [translate_table: standard]
MLGYEGGCRDLFLGQHLMKEQLIHCCPWDHSFRLVHMVASQISGQGLALFYTGSTQNIRHCWITTSSSTVGQPSMMECKDPTLGVNKSPRKAARSVQYPTQLKWTLSELFKPFFLAAAVGSNSSSSLPIWKEALTSSSHGLASRDHVLTYYSLASVDMCDACRPASVTYKAQGCGTPL